MGSIKPIGVAFVLLNLSHDAGDGLLEHSVADSSQVAWGQLSTNKEWFVTPPVAVRLKEAVVQRVLDHEQVSNLVAATATEDLSP